MTIKLTNLSAGYDRHPVVHHVGGLFAGGSIGIGLGGAAIGLALAFAYNVPSGPAIILIVGAIYILSLLLGRFGSVRARYFPFRHFRI